MKESMIVLQQLSYAHPDKDVLFSNLNLTVNRNDKIALVGNNGSGKSTLLKIVSGEAKGFTGNVSVEVRPYFVPQIFGQYNDLTVSQALGVDERLRALHQILNGEVAIENFDKLGNDWSVEERCREALDKWGLETVELGQKLGALSGGEKARVFLAGIDIHGPELILMDEPSNHLDASARTKLNNLIEATRSTLVVVTHDRALLNIVTRICELTPDGIEVYGGNYAFFEEQKQIKRDAVQQDILSKENMLRAFREKEREMIERKQRENARGKARHEKAGVARIMINTLRNAAENSTAKVRGVHNQKIEGLTRELKDIRASLPDIDKMKLSFDNSLLHKGKVLFAATDLNVVFDSGALWKSNLNLSIVSGERVALKGHNGSGKTTLIKILLGERPPSIGYISRADSSRMYIDQDYSLIDNSLTVIEQVQQFNRTLLDHEVGIRLNRFLFPREVWDKSCSGLSGGERMRLMLCCLTVKAQIPDVVFLDEPGNNLDIQNLEILTSALNEYRGTLVIVSHDEVFLSEVKVERTIALG